MIKKFPTLVILIHVSSWVFQNCRDPTDFELISRRCKDEILEFLAFTYISDKKHQIFFDILASIGKLHVIIDN